MIISYLMSPRFYPELDTLELLNETCCWEPFRLAPSYNFKQLDKCSSITMFGYVENDNRLLIEQAYDNSYCVKIDEWQWMELNQNPLLAMTSGLYRWSNKIINEWPSVAWLMGDPVVAEKVSTLGYVYFGEGSLSKGARVGIDDSRILSQESTLKSTTLDELSLLWIVYAAGVISSVVAFLVEVMIFETRSCQPKTCLKKCTVIWRRI